MTRPAAIEAGQTYEFLGEPAQVTRVNEFEVYWTRDIGLTVLRHVANTSRLFFEQHARLAPAPAAKPKDAKKAKAKRAKR